MNKKQKEHVLVNNSNIDRLLREHSSLRQQLDKVEERYLSFKVASVKHYNEAADAAFSYKNALRFVVNEKLELEKQFNELLQINLRLINCLVILMERDEK